MKIRTAIAKSDTLSLSTLRAMKDRTLIMATIAEVRKTGDQLSRFLVYADEARKRFDNRGRSVRVISGFRGWQDFVERGLQTNIRTFQRRLAEFNDPGKAEERRRKDRERDLVQKVNAQCDANILAGSKIISDYCESVRPYIESASQKKAVSYPHDEDVPQPEPLKLVPVTVQLESREERTVTVGVYRDPPVDLDRVTRNGQPLFGTGTAPAQETVERVFLAVRESEIEASSEVFAVYTDAPSNGAAAETAERIARANSLELFGGRSYRLLRK